MAAVDVTISGVLYDKLNRTMQNVVLIGEATLTGLGVGGGPIMPPPGGAPPEWGTWPPQRPPHPAHPIVNPAPGGPEPPERPPEPIQPPIEWKPIWIPGEGWVVVGKPNFPHPAPSSPI